MSRSPLPPSMKHRFFSVACTGVLGLLSACADGTPTGPTAEAPEVAPHVERGHRQATYRAEERFVRLAHIVPGFGGYFLDRARNVHVYLTDRSRGRQLRGALFAHADPQLRRLAGKHPRIVVHQGRYDFLQLQTWRDQLFRDGARDLHSIAIDEGANTVRIGVATLAAASGIRALASRLGIPQLALRIDLSPPDMDLQTLSDIERPPVGGILITVQQTGQQCALGYNTLGGMYFVTGSHCTRVRGPDGADITRFFQPDPARGYYAGFESEDPEYFSNAVEPTCPSTSNVCRWSDAALIAYVTAQAPGAAGQGRLARTVYFTDGFTEDGSKDIVGHLTITGEANFPVMGQELGKIGPFSGWTAGPVIETCRHILSGGYTYLCQDVIHANAKLGDSGGPVFELHGGYTVTFHGIVRGWSVEYGGVSYSSFGNISADFGYLPAVQ